MKTKMIFLSCLIGMVVLFIPVGRNKVSLAKSTNAGIKAASAASKIGVVNIREIFDNSKKQAKYTAEATAKRNKLETELNTLAREIEADQEALKTRKELSNDHESLLGEILVKRAIYKTKQEVYKNQIERKDIRWTEQLYKDILQIVNKVAAEKGLALVLEKSEPQLPALNVMNLISVIRTHKVLYSKDCLDITAEVMARLDGEQ